MNEITWTLNLKVKDGPTFAPTSTMKVEAYDKVDIEVGVKQTEMVRIQPGTKKEIEFLMLILTDPKVDPPLEGEVTYKVSSATDSTGGGTSSGGGSSSTTSTSAGSYNAGTDDESAGSGANASQAANRSASTQAGTQTGSDDGWIVLDYVHVVLGKGALALLKDEPQVITFKNTQPSAAHITVLVGRTAKQKQEERAGAGIRTGMGA